VLIVLLPENNSLRGSGETKNGQNPKDGTYATDRIVLAGPLLFPLFENILVLRYEYVLRILLAEPHPKSGLRISLCHAVC